MLGAVPVLLRKREADDPEQAMRCSPMPYAATSRAPRPLQRGSRKPWASADLGATDEQNIFARYGASFDVAGPRPPDGRAPVRKDATDAERLLSMTSAARRGAVHGARSRSQAALAGRRDPLPGGHRAGSRPMPA